MLHDFTGNETRLSQRKSPVCTDKTKIPKERQGLQQSVNSWPAFSEAAKRYRDVVQFVLDEDLKKQVQRSENLVAPSRKNVCFLEILHFTECKDL